jgi:nucleotide-binding universal stress UspA family protein
MPQVDENTIVVGIDGSECSHHALTWALAEAKRSNRWLLLVHVRHWSSDVIGSPMSLVGAPDSHKAGHHLLHAASARAKTHGVTAITRLVEGSRASALAEAAEGAAMLVVGAHSYRAVSRALMGSVSQRCLRHARCPVVVVGSAVHNWEYAHHPSQASEAPIGAGALTYKGRRHPMQVSVGDRIIVRGHRIGEPDRDCEVLEVRDQGGTPPYLVRWEDTGHQALLYPGPDAKVQHFEHVGN